MSNLNNIFNNLKDTFVNKTGSINGYLKFQRYGDDIIIKGEEGTNVDPAYEDIYFISIGIRNGKVYDSLFGVMINERSRTFFVGDVVNDVIFYDGEDPITLGVDSEISESTSWINRQEESDKIRRILEYLDVAVKNPGNLPNRVGWESLEERSA